MGKIYRAYLDIRDIYKTTWKIGRYMTGYEIWTRKTR